MGWNEREMRGRMKGREELKDGPIMRGGRRVNGSGEGREERGEGEEEEEEGREGREKREAKDWGGG